MELVLFFSVLCVFSLFGLLTQLSKKIWQICIPIVLFGQGHMIRFFVKIKGLD